MSVARIAISLDIDLARRLRKAVKKGEPLSAWLADAVRRKLRAQGLADVVCAWEAEHGEITQAELEAAAQKRKAPKRRSVSRRAQAGKRRKRGVPARRRAPHAAS